MVAISQHHREQITKAVVAHGYADRIVASMNEGHALFLALYDRLFTPKQLKAMQSMLDAFPAGEDDKQALPFIGQLQVNAAGPNIQVGARPNGDSTIASYAPKGVKFDEKVVPSSVSRKLLNWDVVLALPSDDPLVDRVLTWAHGREELASSLRARSKEVNAALSAFRSDKQLREGWPEVWPIAAGILPENDTVKPSLPATLRTSLNADLGLPPMQEAA